MDEKIQRYIDRGKKALSPEKHDYWCKIVPIRVNDFYRGMELNSCLDIIELLNNKYSTIQEAIAMIENQDHSGASFGLVRALVKEFHVERGEEFANSVK